MSICNVLSIDGCGFRGLTQLLVLQRLMEDVGEALGRSRDNPPRPCEVFDLICGTATGGLIAILVGRLGMSCQQAINAYNELEGKIFSPGGVRLNISDILNRHEPFDITSFQTRLEQIVRENADNGARNPLRMTTNDRHTRQCKTFVTIANRKAAVDEDAYRIRSYERTSDLEIDPGHIWLIHEAAIGATSCQRLFQSLEVTNSETGGTFLVQAANLSGFSNSSMIAYLDAIDVFGNDAEITLVSLGMGLRNRHSYGVLEQNEIDAMVGQMGININDGVNKEHFVQFIMQTQAVATTAQIKHLRVGNLMGRRPGPDRRYFRFDPPRDGRTSGPNSAQPAQPPRPFVLVDHLQDDTIDNITRDFFNGGYRDIKKGAVPSLSRAVAKASQWREHRGLDCDVKEVEKWRITDPTHIMLRVYEWEENHPGQQISCFATDSRTKTTDVMTEPIRLSPDRRSTLYVRVLLDDDEWEFFPRRRANQDWDPENWMNVDECPHNPIGLILAAQRDSQIKAFNSDGFYTTAPVDPSQVDMITDDNFLGNYQGTWIKRPQRPN